MGCPTAGGLGGGSPPAAGGEEKIADFQVIWSHFTKYIDEIQSPDADTADRTGHSPPEQTRDERVYRDCSTRSFTHRYNTKLNITLS